jgi:L-2-hydroxycarboxylate dehydrogenase (NAD+)
MKISLKELEDLTARAIEKEGYSDKEVHVMMDVLLYAKMCDNNQGIVKLIDKGIPPPLSTSRRNCHREGDLHIGTDQRQQKSCTDSYQHGCRYIFEKGSHTWRLAITGTYITNTSSGAIGYYASRLAREGLISFTFSLSP